MLNSRRDLPQVTLQATIEIRIERGVLTMFEHCKARPPGTKSAKTPRRAKFLGRARIGIACQEQSQGHRGGGRRLYWRVGFLFGYYILQS